MAKKKSSIRKAVKPAAEEVKKAEVAVEVKTEPEVLAEPVKEEVKAEPAAEVKEEKKPAPKKKCAPKKKAEPVKEEVKAEPAPAAAEPAAEVKEEPKEEKKAAPKKKCAPRKKKEEVKAEPAVEEVPVTEPAAAEEPAPVAEEAAPAVEETAVPEEAPVVEEVKEEYYSPRRSIAFIGSECYPFVKTGGLGDVMYALPKELVKQNCDVRVILPRYKCIKQQWQEKMEYRGAFQMDLCSDGRSYYVGIMEYIEDGVVYDFIDNEEFFSNGNPYTTIVDDIPKFCYFSKAAIAALNYMNWVPNIIHCHDWQAALVPVFLRTLFAETPCGQARTILTIHNLRFQGIYDIPTIKYWTGLPGYCFNDAVLKEGRRDANMLKGGIAY
ncbi:MAG: glycogen/starch synthase, partial [Erysipelotrichaceae bacterium]|nr:glycogen/starch synthase [Erysipelotrichaceae bacterium]